MKFPRIELMKFDGDITKWVEFRDQYMEMVHSNIAVPEAIQFAMLQNHLKGTAADAIAGLPATADGYPAAWAALFSKYENNDLIKNEWIKRLFELPTLSAHPGRAKFLAMIDNTLQLKRIFARI